MELHANAKLNLFLNIEKKLDNGYHDLETILLPIDLHDIIHINPIEENKIIITTNNLEVPTDEKNTLYKCAELMKNNFNIHDGVKIHLNKQIPLSAGLGGESTDAAALMHFYDTYYNLRLNYSDVFHYGRLISWDVPTCFYNKCFHISGNKGICNVINTKFNYYILLVQPDFRISTKEAFEEIDKCQLKIFNSDELLKNLLAGNKIKSGLFNCFIYSNEKLHLEYKKLCTYSEILGFDAVSMSGTGSCFFLLTKDINIAQKGFLELSKQYKFVKISSTIKL